MVALDGRPMITGMNKEAGAVGKWAGGLIALPPLMISPVRLAVLRNPGHGSRQFVGGRW